MRNLVESRNFWLENESKKAFSLEGKLEANFGEKAVTINFQPSHRLNSLTIKDVMSLPSLAYSSPESATPTPSHSPSTVADGSAFEKSKSVAAIISELWKGPVPSSEVADPRMRRLAGEVAQEPDNWEKIRAGMAETQLSPAYLSVRFKQSTGLPMRSYALWMKFERACLLALSGHRPADAASMAGFTDQSHLGRASRRFAKMSFGKAMLVLKKELNSEDFAPQH